MIDNRIYTFLEVCTVMNYHKTAENLNMTQPAVSQHIKYLENLYHCKLFEYSNKKLAKTKKAEELEKYARKIIALNKVAKQDLVSSEQVKIKIGASKTIGEYMISEKIASLAFENNYDFNLIIDNTENLLDSLNHFELDLLLLEGYVDKQKYLYQKITQEEIVGICSVTHPFAFKEVGFEELFNQKIVLREKGSGTRAVFENFLIKNGYSVEMFEAHSVISSNKFIERVVEMGTAVSFVYKVIPENNKNLATFKIRKKEISHEMNYIFLNQAKAEKAMRFLEDVLHKE